MSETKIDLVKLAYAAVEANNVGKYLTFFPVTSWSVYDNVIILNPVWEIDIKVN
jgi:hypothetical protein